MLNRLNQLKLGTRFTIILGVVLLGGIFISYITLSRALEQRAQDEVTTRGLVLIETMSAVRSYTSNHINPLLIEQLNEQETFISEVVPGYSAREVFEGFRNDSKYEDFLYKEATYNPTNSRDRADAFETDILTQFQSDTSLSEINGFRNLNGKNMFYIARPMRVGSESCLGCHGDPADAPASLINTYGSENGFGWELGELTTAQIIYVPAEDVFQTAQLSLLLVMIIFVIIFTLVILLINFLLRNNVISTISNLAVVAEKVSAGNVTTNDLKNENIDRTATRGDELGQLSRVFQKMSEEVIKREEQLKEQVHRLEIKINEQRKQKDIDQISESEFFQMLQKKSKELRGDKDQDTD